MLLLGVLFYPSNGDGASLEYTAEEYGAQQMVRRWLPWESPNPLPIRLGSPQKHQEEAAAAAIQAENNRVPQRG